MAYDSGTYNAQITTNPYVNLSLSGKVFTITERFLDTPVGSTHNFLIQTTSVPYAMTIHATAGGGDFLYDSLLVSSFSGGFVPNIANRNAFFVGITSLVANVFSDVVIEQLVRTRPILSRCVPTGPGGITIGGGTPVDVPIILPRNFTLGLQITKAEDPVGVTKPNISDLYVILHEINVTTTDLGLPPI